MLSFELKDGFMDWYLSKVSMLKTLCAALLCLLVSGCSSSSKIVQTYEGEPLAPEQFAVLVAPEHISIVSVNGVEVTSYLLSDVVTNYGLKPGSNDVVFKYESVWAKPGGQAGGGPRSEKTESAPMFVSFDAKPGGVYRFTFEEADNIREARQLANEFSAMLVNKLGDGVASSAPYKGQAASDRASSFIQRMVSGVTTNADDEGASHLDEMKALWSKASAEDRKAFLAWAFQE